MQPLHSSPHLSCSHRSSGCSKTTEPAEHSSTKTSHHPGFKAWTQHLLREGPPQESLLQPNSPRGSKQRSWPRERPRQVRAGHTSLESSRPRPGSHTSAVAFLGQAREERVSLRQDVPAPLVLHAEQAQHAAATMLLLALMQHDRPRVLWGRPCEEERQQGTGRPGLCSQGLWSGISASRFIHDPQPAHLSNSSSYLSGSRTSAQKA